ncbi:MAG: SGNH/GDSL hydrolase family protein [Ilumatobacteraceae bacterium]
MLRRLTTICLVLGAATVAAACGDTVTNVEPTVETVGVGDLPGVVDDTSRIVDHGTVRTTVPLSPEERLGNFVSGNRVIMIGDSVMASTAQRYGDNMCDTLVPLDWQVEVDAETGRFVQWGNFVLDYRLEETWDVAVILLGNNYGGNIEYYHDQLERMVERLEPALVVLMTVTEIDDGRVDVNNAIFDIAANHQNVYVLDWAAVTASDASLTGEDGLHLTVEGRERMATEVSLVLGDAPVSPGDCLPTDFTDDSMGPVTGPNDTIDTTNTATTSTPSTDRGHGKPTTLPPDTTALVDTTVVDTTSLNGSGTTPTTIKGGSP